METIRKTVESKYAPKQTNVIWVDTSGNTPVEKHFIKGKWREMSGGGAGSSNPTEADATKVWQVTPVLKETKTEAFDILHEYTDTFHYDANLILDAINLDKFTTGSKCTFTVGGGYYDGDTYEGFIEDYGGMPGVRFSETPFEFYVTQEGLVFNYGGSEEELTLSLSVEQETSIYDYNWAPGVKIPIPTAEDEGKTLVVTKVEGDNTSTIVPEQEVPEDGQTPLTDVDLTKFVAGNTVKVTVSDNSQTFTAIGVIVEKPSIAGVIFDIQELDGEVEIVKIKNSLMTNAFQLGLTNSTIKLEYIESNYEYQLTDNVKGCDLTNLECFNNSAIYSAYRLQDILNDGYTYVYFGNSNNGSLYIVKIEGDNPSYNNGQFIDCSPIVIPSFLVDMYNSPWNPTTPVLFHACNIHNNNDISYEFRQNVFGFDFNHNNNGYNLDKVKGLGIVENLGKYILGAYWTLDHIG